MRDNPSKVSMEENNNDLSKENQVIVD